MIKNLFIFLFTFFAYSLFAQTTGGIIPQPQPQPVEIGYLQQKDDIGYNLSISNLTMLTDIELNNFGITDISKIFFIDNILLDADEVKSHLKHTDGFASNLTVSNILFYGQINVNSNSIYNISELVFTNGTTLSVDDFYSFLRRDGDFANNLTITNLTSVGEANFSNTNLINVLSIEVTDGNDIFYINTATLKRFLNRDNDEAINLTVYNLKSYTNSLYDSVLYNTTSTNFISYTNKLHKSDLYTTFSINFIGYTNILNDSIMTNVVVTDAIIHNLIGENFNITNLHSIDNLLDNVIVTNSAIFKTDINMFTNNILNVTKVEFNDTTIIGDGGIHFKDKNSDKTLIYGLPNVTTVLGKDVIDTFAMKSDINVLSNYIDLVENTFSNYFYNIYTNSSVGITNYIDSVENTFSNYFYNIYTNSSVGITNYINQQDLNILRLYHYGSPDIIESPEEWFEFNPETKTISATDAMLIDEGVTKIVIPWMIDGVVVENVASFSALWHHNKSEINSVIGPKTITYIDHSAFIYCEYLTHISFPSVTNISNAAFKNCNRLQHVDIPNLKIVGPGAFNESGITSINLPKVERIDNGAFRTCPNLISITFSQDAPIIGEFAVFTEGNSNLKLYVDNPFAKNWPDKIENFPVIRGIGYVDNLFIDGEDINELLKENDLTSLRLYYYGSSDIIESPEEWFEFTNGIITKFNYEIGRENVVIPWKINSIDVTEIGNAAFFDNTNAGAQSNIIKINSIALPLTIGRIAAEAFYNCETLTSVVIPGVTNIGDRAFIRNKKLKNIIAPKVIIVGSQSFLQCTDLAKIHLPASKHIGWSAFDGCINLRHVDIPLVNTLGQGVFANCNTLHTIDLPSVEHIDNFAFTYCLNLTNVTFSLDKPFFGVGIFTETLENLKLYVDNPTAKNWPSHIENREVIRLPLHTDKLTTKAITLNDDTITEWPDVESIVDDKIAIHNESDSSHSDIRLDVNSRVSKTNSNEVTDGFNIKNYDKIFLFDLTNLKFNATQYLEKEIKIGNLILKYPEINGEHVFATEKYVDDAINNIPEYEEKDLKALRLYHYGSPDIIESPEEWFEFSNGVITKFKNDIATSRDIVIPWKINGIDVTEIGDGAFIDYDWGDGFNITSLIVSKTLNKIGNNAFANCSALTSIFLPNVTSIGDYAFAGCMSLSSISLPSATFIRESAFANCSALTSIFLPNVTSIGDYAFTYCDSLTSIFLPNVTSIGDFAFVGCVSLTSIFLPNVTSIGNFAFEYCDSLTSISLPNVTSIGDFAFEYCDSLTSISLPNVTSIGDYAFVGCVSLTSIFLPNVTSIGNFAFEYCDSLTSISLPNVTSIGDYAFKYCDSLTSISFSSNLPVFTANTFYYNTDTITIYVDNPIAENWPDEIQGVKVIRHPLYTDGLTLNGDFRTEWPNPTDDIFIHNTNELSHSDIRLAITNTINDFLFSPYTEYTYTITTNDEFIIRRAMGNQILLMPTDNTEISINLNDFINDTNGVIRFIVDIENTDKIIKLSDDYIDWDRDIEIIENGISTLLIVRSLNEKFKGFLLRQQKFLDPVFSKYTYITDVEGMFYLKPEYGAHPKINIIGDTEISIDSELFKDLTNGTIRITLDVQNTTNFNVSVNSEEIEWTDFEFKDVGITTLLIRRSNNQKFKGRVLFDSNEWFSKFLIEEIDPIASELINEHTINFNNPHNVTAEEIGALTNELDLTAMRFYQYGSGVIIESPQEWFDFDAERQAITKFKFEEFADEEDLLNVVIPWEFDGVPTTRVISNAFLNSPATNILGPRNLKYIGEIIGSSATNKFNNWTFGYDYQPDNHQAQFPNVPAPLKSVSFLGVTHIGADAFRYATNLTYTHFPEAIEIGASAFAYNHSLEKLILPKAKILYNDAFAYCPMYELDLSSIEYIGLRAFYQMYNLTNITIRGKMPHFASISTINNITNKYEDAKVFGTSTGSNQGYATNAVIYVDNPIAGEYKATIGEFNNPVIRRPVYADSIILNRVERNSWPDTENAFTPFTSESTVNSEMFTINKEMGNEIYVELVASGGVISINENAWPYNGTVRLTLNIFNSGYSVELDSTYIDWTDVDINENGYTVILLRRVGNTKFKALQLETENE